MTNASQEAGRAINPTYSFLIDIEAIDAIYGCAQQIKDVRNERHLESLRDVHDRIKSKVAETQSAMQDMSVQALRARWHALGPQELIEHSAEVITDVADFAMCAQNLFQEVKTHRALMPDEKAIGQRLITVVNSLRDLLPKQNSMLAG